MTQQLQSVWEDAPPRAVKLGMLTSAETVLAVQQFLSSAAIVSGSSQAHGGRAEGEEKGPTVVLDPVMVSTSGHSLVDSQATDAIRSSLLELADWITPNLPEAKVLAQSSLDAATITDMLTLASQLSEQNPGAHILLKGGHLPLGKADVLDFQRQLGKGEGCRVVWLDEDEDGACIDVLELFSAQVGRAAVGQLVVDVLYEAKDKRGAEKREQGDQGEQGQKVTLYVSRMVDTTSTHGTGCTLSSAIACAVAQTPGESSPPFNAARLYVCAEGAAALGISDGARPCERQSGRQGGGCERSSDRRRIFCSSAYRQMLRQPRYVKGPSNTSNQPSPPPFRLAAVMAPCIMLICHTAEHCHRTS